MPKAFIIFNQTLKIIFLCLCVVKPLIAEPTISTTESELEPNTRDIESIKDVTLKLRNLTSPYLSIKIVEIQPNCVQMQCSFICFNGQAKELEQDLFNVIRNSTIDCQFIEELRIYNYAFPNKILSYGFLGAYSNRVQNLYIATSDISDIAPGAFGHGIFQSIFLVDLRVKYLSRDFFENITSEFEALHIIQRDTPLLSVCSTFLDLVKYQIESLTLQGGIQSIKNITGASNLLNNLRYVDFSHNNLGSSLNTFTFNKLSMVKTLDLSHSNIEHLASGIFADILDTLRKLDLSQNLLLTIEPRAFGWKPMPPALEIEAAGNPWDCNCQVYNDMKSVFLYRSAKLFCVTPEEYANWSVFDSRLCNNENPTGSGGGAPVPTDYTTSTAYSTTPFIPTTTTAICYNCPEAGAPVVETTEDLDNDSIKSTIEPTTTAPENTLLLRCASTTNLTHFLWYTVEYASVDFELLARPEMRVELRIQLEDLRERYGSIWFSRVTSEYYKMEVNYNEYGLGCYRPLEEITYVDNLLPDTAYTFCLAREDSLTISPFDCDSVHVGGNVGVVGWLTRDMRSKGISLVILGIVLFAFAGICVVYMVLKRKPILLMGSKRVTATKSNSQEIVVFPSDKTLEEFRLKEEMLAKRNSASTHSPALRRYSVASIESSDSYMNANLYEVIPAYLKIQDSSLHYEKMDSLDDNYLPPLRDPIQPMEETPVIYAEVPYRAKRISSDPLPAVPQPASPNFRRSQSELDFALAMDGYM